MIHIDIYLLFFSELFFAWLNNFPEYYMFTIIVLILILASLFPTRIMLASFLTVSFVSIVTVILLLPQITNQHYVLIYSLAGASIFIYIMTNERFRVNDDLLKSQDILEATFNESTDAIILVNAKTREIIDYNSSTSSFLNREAIICKKSKHLCNDLVSKILQEKDLSKVSDLKEELKLNIYEKKNIWVDSVIKKIYVGNKSYLMIRLTDISMRHEVEKSKLELEERRRQFMETVSHELRTPLTSIRGFSEILQLRGDYLRPEEKKKCFDFINKNLFRLERLIKDVSEIYKIERGAFKLIKRRIDFNLFLQNEFKAYETLLGKEVQIILPKLEKKVIVDIDEDRISQVLYNLVDNALRHTPLMNRKIILEGKFEVKSVYIIVHDNGAGILSENMDLIFQPFISISTKYANRGTGIGLFVSKIIIQSHNGNLMAESEGENKGARFIIQLPRS